MKRATIEFVIEDEDGVVTLRETHDPSNWCDFGAQLGMTIQKLGLPRIEVVVAKMLMDLVEGEAIKSEMDSRAQQTSSTRQAS